MIGALIGIFPMLYTSVFTSIICYFINSYFPGKLLGYTSWMQIKDIAPSFVISTIMAVVVFILKYLPISNWLILPIQIAVGLIVFILLCKVSKIEEYKEVINMIKPVLNKIKR